MRKKENSFIDELQNLDEKKSLNKNSKKIVIQNIVSLLAILFSIFVVIYTNFYSEKKTKTDTSKIKCNKSNLSVVLIYKCSCIRSGKF